MKPRKTPATWSEATASAAASVKADIEAGRPINDHGPANENLPVDTSSGGVKFDVDKPRMDLIPPEAIYAMGTILAFGAKKYGDRNWEKGLEWGRVYGAAMRHLNAWAAGEDIDPETGESHLWHAITNVAFLIAYEVRAAGTDTRSKFTRLEADAASEGDDLEARCGLPELPNAMEHSEYPLVDDEDEPEDRAARRSRMFRLGQEAVNE